MPLSRTLGLTFLSIILLCAAITTAQQNPPATPTQAAPAPSPAPTPFAKKLNVIVLDKNGTPVNDLRQEDFQVFEDGTAQTITLFSHDETPVSYVLVMDNTGSLRTQFDLAVHAGAAILGGNRPSDETSVVRFAGRDRIEVMTGFTSDSAEMMKAMNGLFIEGGQSAVIDAIYLSAKYAAEQHQGETNRRRALVLITDGEDRDSYYKLEQLSQLLRATDVQIFAIGLVNQLDNDYHGRPKSTREKAENLLDILTAETGGRVFYPKTVEQVRDAVLAIRHDLHMQYVIGYTLPNQSRDDKHRKVQVKLVDRPGVEKRSIIVRKGYILAQPVASPKADVKAKP